MCVKYMKERKYKNMKTDRKSFELVSTFAYGVLIALVVFAIFTNSLIMLSPTLQSVGFPAVGTFAMLYSYGANAGHPMQLLGQILGNIVAYVFILAAVVIFVLSLVLIKHSARVKIKCAILGIALLIPAVFGFTGGILDFFGHGFQVLNFNKGIDTALIMGGIFCTLILDVAFLVLAIKCLVYGISTAVKVNKGEMEPEPEPEERRPYSGEPAEDRAAREEREAAERVELLKQVREIVREELDKLDRVVIAKEVKVAAKAEPKPELKPEPVPAPVEEEEEAKKLSIQRIPFAEKIVKADKELQEKYNEIKSELLAYGASSRVSIACDTFRLHRKPYVKITIVGKTLKVFFALNPKDFEESPIPVVDSSDKVAYEDVPALLKVKSNLSVKRAKELAALAFAADGYERENEPVEHNWVKDIRADLKAKKQAK